MIIADLPQYKTTRAKVHRLYLEIDELTICEPLKLGKAQCRYLTRLGLIVKNKPNGKPLVARLAGRFASRFRRVFSCAARRWHFDFQMESDSN